MTHYLYTRYSPKNRAYQEQLATMTAAFPGAAHVEDSIHGQVPPFERPQFTRLFDTLESGDTLVIWWLTAFGRDFNQVLATVNRLLDKGVALQLICEPLRLEPRNEQTNTLLLLLSGYDKVQTQHRLYAAEQGRNALKDQPELWKKKFRGRPADKAKHQHIASLLLDGHTLQSVAEQCDVSLSTVKRVKARLSEVDDEGSLRRRGDMAAADGDAS
ncbi:Site-specific DNA recombinase [Ferrimonas sediminum]|uniref:Site-specific DNA recombinase n=1 Tax=Ferrimonas sediminum TaxID=718193 RepID=A0A1G8TYZ5_9GAMM|nr:recombinase family protein [Ferrimonas sediminum]SDJ46667.1 Site-specific DNA recombinase [Ferrimonas sediminum]